MRGAMRDMALLPDTGQPTNTASSGDAEYVETVFTCKGDYHDPDFPKKLESFSHRLQRLLCKDKDKLIIKKVEPWNSVKVTLNIPREAVERLKHLAAQNNGSVLRNMGIMSLQLEGDRIISLVLSGSSTQTSTSLSVTSGAAASRPDTTGLGRVSTTVGPSSINNLFTRPKTSPSTTKETSASLASPARTKQERRPRKRPASKAKTTTHSSTPVFTTPTTPGTSMSTATTTTPVPVSVVSGSSNILTDMLERTVLDHMDPNRRITGSLTTHKQNAVSMDAGLVSPPATNPSSSVLQDAVASPPKALIHPALKDTKPSEVPTTTVSVTGVTDRAAVNNLVSNLFERSLAGYELLDEDSKLKQSHKQTDSNYQGVASSPSSSSSPLDLSKGSSSTESDTSKVIVPPDKQAAISLPTTATSSSNSPTRTAQQANVVIPSIDAGVVASAPKPKSPSHLLPTDFSSDSTNSATDGMTPDTTRPAPSTHNPSSPPRANSDQKNADPVTVSIQSESTSVIMPPHSQPSVSKAEEEEVVMSERHVSVIQPIPQITEVRDIQAQQPAENMAAEPIPIVQPPTSLTVSPENVPERLDDVAQVVDSMTEVRDMPITTDMKQSVEESASVSPDMSKDVDQSNASSETPPSPPHHIMEWVSSPVPAPPSPPRSPPQPPPTEPAVASPVSEVANEKPAPSPSEKPINSDVLSNTNLSQSEHSDSIITADVPTDAPHDQVESSHNPTTADPGSPPSMEICRSDTQEDASSVPVLPAYRNTESFYSLPTVSAELPDDIMDSEDTPDDTSGEVLVGGTTPSKSSPPPTTQGQGVSVICAPLTSVGDVAVPSIEENKPVMKIKHTYSNTESALNTEMDSAQIIVEMNDNSSKVDTDECTSKVETLCEIPAEDRSVIVKGDNELPHYPSETSKVSKPAHQLQILGDHEPAENGSSTSTDSGVNTGSPKSDLCPTPPYDDHLHHVSTIKPDTATSTILETVTETKSSPALTLASVSLTTCAPDRPLVRTAEPTVDVSTSKSDHSTISILKPVTTVQRLSTPAQLTQLSDTVNVAKIPASSYSGDGQRTPTMSVISKPGALFNLLRNPASSKSEVLLAVASLAEKDQQQQSAMSERHKRSLLAEPRIDSNMALTNSTERVVGPVRSGNVIDKPVTSVGVPTHLPHLYRGAGTTTERLVILENGSQSIDTRGIGTVQKDYADNANQQYSFSNDRLIPLGHTYTKPASYNNKPIPTRVSHNKEVVTVHVPQSLDSSTIKLLGNGSPSSTPSSFTQISLKTLKSSNVKEVASEKSLARSHVDSIYNDVPTHLPPVTIINSQYSKSKTLTNIGKVPSTMDSSDRLNSESCRASSLTVPADNALVIEGNEPIKSLPPNDDPPSSPTPHTKPVHTSLTKPLSPSQTVKPDSVPAKNVTIRKPGETVNGLLARKEAELELAAENSHPLSVSVGDSDVGSDSAEIVSPSNGQRKSGRNRTLKSPDPELYSLATKVMRKRPSKDETVTTLNEDRPATTPPPNKRAPRTNAPPPSAVSPTANGPSSARSKRSTRSSGNTDLQALPTIYRERKRTKR